VGHKPVGMGFLVGPRHVLTCAHVVTSALGEAHPERVTQAPQAPILMDFPLLDIHHRKQRFVGQVISWDAYQSDRAGDMACLLLNASPPADAQEAQLKIKASLWKQEFRAFGVPTGYESGVWTQGEVLGREANGYFQVHKVGAGYDIQPGFSGGPIWSEQLQAVVGMLTLADRNISIGAAFAVPARMLLDVVKKHTSITNAQLMPATALTLVQLMGFDKAQLASLAQTQAAAAQHPKADVEDLLSAALSSLFMGRYDVVRSFLERLIQIDSGHAYAHYALALCHLNGKRPASLQNFDRARLVLNTITQVAHNTNLAHIHLLIYYIKQDYFQRNGFSAYSNDIGAVATAARTGQINRAELDALAILLPDITGNALWSELHK